MSNTVPRGGRPRLKRGPRGELAERLRAARHARAWSQARAADDLGIPQSTLAAWESGTKRPTHLATRYLVEVWIPRLEECEG